MRTAYAEAHAAHLSGKGEDTDGSLDLASSGRRANTTVPGKLPPEFEKAYQRDKEKGLFKDRKEFVENLSPNVRAANNL